MKVFSIQRRGWGLIVLSSLCLLVSPAFADDDDDSSDDDDFTPISECGTIISAPGSFKLVNDLVGCNVQDPIEGRPFSLAIGIASDNVTLDLDGNTISCGPAQFFPIGVFTQPSLSKLRIKNGTVTGCGLGVLLNVSNRSSVKGMTLTGNFNGVEVLAGEDNEIKRNLISNNFRSGVFLNSFFFSEQGPIFLGNGVDHRITKNQIANNEFGISASNIEHSAISRNLIVRNAFGIDANNIEDNTISCNRADRNFVHGMSFSDSSSGNRIWRNVTNNNQSDGITLVGLAEGGDVFSPLPVGNDVKGNTALGNWSNDLTEGIFDFADFSFVPPPGGACPNDWSRNQYINEVANPGCIAAPVVLDTMNGCAPGTDNDSDKDENALRDPGFERQLPPEQGGWSFSSFIGVDQIFFAEDHARTGRRSLLHSGFGFNASVQEIPAAPGSQWRLTGYGLTPAGLFGGAFGIVRISFFDASGNNLGTVETAGEQFPELPSNPIDGRSPDNQWLFLDSGIGTAPEGTVSIQASSFYLDFSSDAQKVYFDDLKLCELDDEFECIELDDDDDSSDDDSSDDD